MEEENKEATESDVGMSDSVGGWIFGIAFWIFLLFMFIPSQERLDLHYRYQYCMQYTVVYCGTNELSSIRLWLGEWWQRKINKEN